MSKCQKHGLPLCSQCIVVTDAAKRMSDHINLMITCHQVWEIADKWMAFKLIDGGSDGVLYDTRQDAITHQLDERWCCYISFRSLMQGANPKDCQIFLDLNRQAYDAGMRLSEPQAPQMIVPSHYYDQLTGRIRPRGSG